MTLRRRTHGQDLDRKALYRDVFMRDWYLDRYPDVAESGTDPLDHFVLQGEIEGREPNPHFSTPWVRRLLTDDTPGKERPLERFLTSDVGDGLKPNPCVDPQFIARNRDDLCDCRLILRALCTGEYLQQTSEWFSPREYTQLYPDLAGVIAPETHFLEQGIHEGRHPKASYKVIMRERFLQGPERSCVPVDEFWWNGCDYVVVKTGPPDAVVAQILTQAQIDPRAVSVGVKAVGAVPTYTATDIQSRDLIDARGLISLAKQSYDVVILLPTIGLGGAEKYIAQLAQAMHETLGSRVLILTSESGQSENLELLRGLRRLELARVDVSSFKDLTHQTWKADFVLALLLLAIRPSRIVVANSEVGFQCLTRYGKALATVSQLIACFFSESPYAVGAPYSARFADALPAGTLILSDNANVQKVLAQRLFMSDETLSFRVLPQHIDPPDEFVTTAEVNLRSARWGAASAKRILWISRWEPFKNVDVISLLAVARSDFMIDAYGPSSDLANRAQMPNLKGHGPVWDMSAFDLSQFDCFLFTSQFEGMPNVVLEMAVRRIPVVAPAVGGLTETFDGSGIDLYANQDSSAATAETIASVLDELFAREPAIVEARSRLAANQVQLRHSEAAFRRGVAELIGLE